MRKNPLALLLTAVILCGLFSACASAPSGNPPDSGAENAVPQSADTRPLFVGIAQDLDESLDPHKAVAAGTKEVLFNLFEGLVKPSPDGDLIPAVAESIDVSDDHLTYTFTIRPGIKFHDGAPVTPEDVKYSVLRSAGTDEPDVVTVKALSAVRTVETPDEHTVVITLNAPDPDFLSYLTLAVLPAGYDGQDTKPVGTGPYRFVSRTAQESVVLERFDDYWGEPAAIARVTYRIVENAESILMSLQSGAVDLFAHLTALQTQQLSPDEFYIEEGSMNLVQALYLNNAVEPFGDLRVRRALCYAVDRQGILDMAFDGYGFLIGSSMYPAFSKYFNDELTDWYPHDPEQARALLAEAGYPDGFSMTITVPSNYQPHLDTAQVIVEQLKEVGIQARILPVEWGTWLEDVYANRNFETTVIGVDASNMTARALLERFRSDSSKNFINYNNEEYDLLFDIAQFTYDDEERTKLYQQLERNLTENAANVYIQDMADLVAVRKGLEGLRFYPIYVLDLSALRWTDGE